jgi:hypothetical protein
MNQVTVIHSAFEDTPVEVALVDVGDRTGLAALEYAYERTNNIMGSWSKPAKFDFNGQTVANEDFSEDVTVLAPLPLNRDGFQMGLRSTSVGDTIIMGESVYKVGFAGFKEIA